nr:PIN domain-containing protein [Rhodoferax sp. OV413]
MRPAQTHVLVDWENVQPKDLDIRVLVPDVTHVWIFHGPTQKRVGDNQLSFGNELTLVPISRSGKNALDFHLSYYVGYISSRNPSAKFVVLSNDQGYRPMLEHAKELGFAASQLGFGAPKAVAKKAGVKKAPAKKVVAKKAAPTKKSIPVNKPPATKQPTKAAKATTGKASVAERSARAPAQAKKAVSGATNTPKVVNPSVASATGGKPTPAVNKKLLVVDDETVYSHVLASLRKSKNKPSRKARLFGAVKSLLGVEKADDIKVERFVQRLVDDGHLVIDANGTVTKTP